MAQTHLSPLWGLTLRRLASYAPPSNSQLEGRPKPHNLPSLVPESVPAKLVPFTKSKILHLKTDKRSGQRMPKDDKGNKFPLASTVHLRLTQAKQAMGPDSLGEHVTVNTETIGTLWNIVEHHPNLSECWQMIECKNARTAATFSLQAWVRGSHQLQLSSPSCQSIDHPARMVLQLLCAILEELKAEKNLGVVWRRAFSEST